MGLPKFTSYVIKRSRHIRQIGHSSPSTLRVTFSSGATYEYDEVSPAIFSDFVASESIGGFFANHIRGKYPYRKLAPNTP